MKIQLLLHFMFGILLSCTPLLAVGQTSTQDYPEGWKIEFIDSELPTLSDDHVVVNKIVRNISAAGNVYKGAKFSCSITNYGSYNFVSFSLETADEVSYKMFHQPETYALSIKPEVITDEDDMYFVKFTGQVKNEDDVVEITGYFKNY